MHAKSHQSCPTLCDSMDCSPPGPSVHGTLRARTLEWVTMPFPRGSSRPRDQTRVSYVSCGEGSGTHSSTLAWKIPWTEEPGGLQSMGSLRIGHDWATSLSLFTFMHRRRKWQPTPVFLPGESQGRGSLMGCCLWGRTELDTTEATSQQQQQHHLGSRFLLSSCAASRFFFFCSYLSLHIQRKV